jgi:Uma2 family endonuclease
VNVQSGIVLSDHSEPEPDIAVLRRREPPYKEREAHSEDVLLLIEVADGSLAYDRSAKSRLYAEARIAEYWVVDCTAEVVEVHRRPGPDGYGEVRRFTGTAVVSPLAFPDLEVPLTDIFA